MNKNILADMKYCILFYNIIYLFLNTCNVKADKSVLIFADIILLALLFLQHFFIIILAAFVICISQHAHKYATKHLMHIWFYLLY